jgi:hypothetical protein
MNASLLYSHKQILVLFFLLPLFSISQYKKNPYVFESTNTDNKDEFYWGIYNHEQKDVKMIHYNKDVKCQEVNYKGFYYKTLDVKGTNGITKPTRIEYRTYDGFLKIYNKGEICYEKFFINNTCVYEIENCFFSFIPRYEMGDSYNKSNEFDLEFMVNLFLDDLINNNLERGEPSLLIKNIRLHRKSPINRIKIDATFTTLEKGVLAQSYGFKDDKNIILKVDPQGWAKASSAKKWYTLYHELGHDVLNFEHGQGGKMMFNYSEQEYNWEDFNDDRNYMFDVFLKKQPIQPLKKK